MQRGACAGDGLGEDAQSRNHSGCYEAASRLRIGLTLSRRRLPAAEAQTMVRP